MVPNYQNWEQKLFKSVLKLDRGSSPRPIVDFMTDADDGVNWIKIGDTKKGELYINSTKEKITPEGAKKSRKVSKGEIIVSNSMSYGQPYILNIDGYIHDGWFVIRNYEKHFEKNYLLQFLGSELIQRQYKRLAAGGVVSNISSDLVYAVKATIPPLPEQRKIAQILSTWDRGIATTEKLIDASKQQKKALMQQLLTGKKRLVNPETGKAFEGEWEVHTFEDYFDIGSSKRVLQSEWKDEGVPFYRTRELVSLAKREAFRSEIFISKELFDSLKEKYGTPTKGDLLVSGVGTLGIFYLVGTDDKFYFKDGNVLWFKNLGNIDSKFFDYCIHSDFVKNQILNQATITTVGTYTITNAKKTKFR